MARQRLQVVADRSQFANLLTKLEGGKSSVKVGDMRETMKRMVQFEADLYKKGHKSALLLLRREAIQLAKQQQAKGKKNVRSNRRKRSKKA